MEIYVVVQRLYLCLVLCVGAGYGYTHAKYEREMNDQLSGYSHAHTTHIS